MRNGNIAGRRWTPTSPTDTNGTPVATFDKNGKFLYDFGMGQEPSDIHLIYIGVDRSLWTAKG